ncbi:glutamate receptor ionotropic, kainate 2 [Octopus bimaculoides]|uniref:glutamate receptor ionotropic, kainate 2 n=1 Tax=Octopus bimaculoides TaxID=37653 RepID=UPI00071DCE4A|nr:glutamate receptor ionotropic, kainate 2 [Octopus bimaculoides]|eukprot:XP_014768777.1 PREDICTED: glutamate receptor ionotropic, kainate 2-like [Octopus bimaculoides]
MLGDVFTFITLSYVLPIASGNKIDHNRPVVINVGVYQPLSSLFNDVTKDRNASTYFKITDIYQSQRSTNYEDINKTILYMELHNIHTIVGPFDPGTVIAAEELGISFLSTSSVSRENSNKVTFQMVPDTEEVSIAMQSLVDAYKWEHAGMYYDSDIGASFMEFLLRDYKLSLKAWRLAPSGSNKTILDCLINMRKVFIQKVIVATSTENTLLILEHARNLAMLSNPYEWIFHDPDGYISSTLRSFVAMNTNFTVLSYLPLREGHSDDTLSNTKSYPRAVVSDIVEMLKNASISLKRYPNIEEMREKTKRKLQKFKKHLETGCMHLSKRGKRKGINLYFTAVFGEMTQKIAIWNSTTSKQFHVYQRKIHPNITYMFPLKGRRVKVVSILEKPFTMYKDDYEKRYGNDRFRGFAVDLMDVVSKRLGFEYDLYLVGDGNFGAKMDNGDWNGMIGEVLAGNATMTVSPLSINSQREEAVDFTKPFMTRYISVIMKKTKLETSYFEFLNPLSPPVWICTFGAFIVVSVILYFLEKLGMRKKKDYPSISFRESFWFIFGSLLQGNTDASPNTVPGRILTSAWWFFALILISSYTANLAAFLTVKKINTPIKTISDLPKQTKIKYGTVKNSGVMAFFKNTKIETFAKMWVQMAELDPESMVSTTTEGFHKVKEGNYAFFWDTTVSRYKSIEDCELTEIGPRFDPKGFGIAVPPGATYREDLSMVILNLSDTGKLHELESRWWNNRMCPDMNKASAVETSELQFENVAGVFFLLVTGILVAGVVCLIEYCSGQVMHLGKENRTRRNKSNYI